MDLLWTRVVLPKYKRSKEKGLKCIRQNTQTVKKRKKWRLVQPAKLGVIRFLFSYLVTYIIKKNQGRSSLLARGRLVVPYVVSLCSSFPFLLLVIALILITYLRKSSSKIGTKQFPQNKFDKVQFSFNKVVNFRFGDKQFGNLCLYALFDS